MSQQKILAKLKKKVETKGFQQVAKELRYSSGSTIHRWFATKNIPSHALENAKRYVNA